MDLANYMNETMLDNAYPCKNGVGYYLENLMTENELELLIACYLEHYFDHHLSGEKSSIDKAKWVQEEAPKLKKEVF